MKQMKKITAYKLIKNRKAFKACRPKYIRLSFYICPMSGIKKEIESETFEINLLDKNIINPTLFDLGTNKPEANIYALMDENVLSKKLTGEALGIYNYKCKTCDNKDKEISGKIKAANENAEEPSFFDTDEEDFGSLLLAQEDPLTSGNIVATFKGYLEVKLGEESVIHRCDGGGDILAVSISNKEVAKYCLRHGDEIVCACKQEDGKFSVGTLFSINQQSCKQFNLNRPWFKDLRLEGENSQLVDGGFYTQPIINKFKMLKGDSVSVFINRSSSKYETLPKFIADLDHMFDKVIYINPEYKLMVNIPNGVARFCSMFSDNVNRKITTTLMGVNYARRLMELGKSVAIILDDIDTISALDRGYKDESPVTTTVLRSVKVARDGSGTLFTIIPVRNYDIQSYKLNPLFKSCETLGIVIENNAVDLFNSYRV